jgi:aryl sulfotransferase
MTQASQVAWPVKSRELQNHHMDSTAWNNFRFRDDDIVIATYAKSGTTWMQQIIAQLVFHGAENIDLAPLSPWIDFRLVPAEAIAGLERQTHRRFVKTHLPVDALVFSPRAKYIYIGRDGRDALWSFYNHHLNHTPDRYAMINNKPGRVGPPFEPPSASIHDYFRRWLAEDGYPYWSFWENVRSWWNVRGLPNVKLVHFNDLKADLAGSIREIAAFLAIPLDEARFAAIVTHCGFDYMKAHAEQMAPGKGGAWTGGATTFINKGTNGRWRDTLTSDDIAGYEARALSELGPDCAAWLAGGRSTVAKAS